MSVRTFGRRLSVLPANSLPNNFPGITNPREEHSGLETWVVPRFGEAACFD